MLHKMKIDVHGLSPLLMQNPFSNFVLAINKLSVDRFQNFAGPIANNRDLDTDRKILVLPSNSKILFPKIKNLS